MTEQCVKLQLCLLGVGVRCTAKAGSVDKQSEEGYKQEEEGGGRSVWDCRGTRGGFAADW